MLTFLREILPRGRQARVGPVQHGLQKLFLISAVHMALVTEKETGVGWFSVDFSL